MYAKDSSVDPAVIQVAIVRRSLLEPEMPRDFSEVTQETIETKIEQYRGTCKSQ